MKACVHTKTCIVQMVPNWVQTKCPSIATRIERLLRTHRVECCSQMKTHCWARMNLKCTRLQEISQTGDYIGYDSIYVTFWNSQNDRSKRANEGLQGMRRGAGVDCKIYQRIFGGGSIASCLSFGGGFMTVCIC